MRRLMREYVRTHKGLWPSDSAIVLTANSATKSLNFHSVSSQLEQLFGNE